MIIEHYDRVKRVHADQQQILNELRPSSERAKPKGVSDELINELVRS